MEIRMAKGNDEIDLACPHCGTDYTDADQEAEAGEAICAQSVVCGYCRNPFEGRRMVKFTYVGVIVPVPATPDR